MSFNNHKIWFVIPVYLADKDKLVGMVRKLSEFGVVLVNNDNLDYLPKTAENIFQFKQIDNFGYGGAANVGIMYALGKGAEWVVVINQDMTITSEFVSSFIRELSKINGCIAGPFAGRLDTKRYTSILDEKDQHKIFKVDYISGSCMAIHKSVISNIGLFSEQYFMYYEDVDYSLRAKKSGIKLVRLTVDGIVHDHQPVLGLGSYTHQYYLARNHLLFVKRQAPKAVYYRETIRIPKTLFDHNRKGEWGAIKGVQDYLVNRFGKVMEVYDNRG
jgi:GT2 family glycosyltransferase